MEDKITRPTIMEIDLNSFKYNINKIKEYVGDNVKIMPVIKADAYGTQINEKIDLINEFDIVAVAIVDEGVILRELGYTKEIFILNQPYEAEIEKIKKYNNIKIEGIYTHLSSTDISEKYTLEQLKSFEKAVNETKKIVPNLRYIHSAASNGILNFKESYYNLVRPGIIIYGYKSEEDTYEKINLKPVAKLKSKITLLKTVKENTSIGYGRNFITKRETKVATIPVGYADGLPRNLSNKGYVIIKGKRAPIIGNICMDGFMADVTDIENVNSGDDVYIWDNKNITLEEIANISGTINYEIISRISRRVPRIFKY